MKANPGCCDEIWFSSWYGFPTLETHRQLVKTLMEGAKKFRANGIRVSLQISNTICHGQYLSSRDCSGLVYSGSPAEKLTDPDDIAADSCFCWNGTHFRACIREVCGMYDMRSHQQDFFLSA